MHAVHKVCVSVVTSKPCERRASYCNKEAAKLATTAEECTAAGSDCVFNADAVPPMFDVCENRDPTQAEFDSSGCSANAACCALATCMSAAVTCPGYSRAPAPGSSGAIFANPLLFETAAAMALVLAC